MPRQQRGVCAVGLRAGWCLKAAGGGERGNGAKLVQNPSLRPGGCKARGAAGRRRALAGCWASALRAAAAPGCAAARGGQLRQLDAAAAEPRHADRDPPLALLSPPPWHTHARAPTCTHDPASAGKKPPPSCLRPQPTLTFKRPRPPPKPCGRDRHAPYGLPFPAFAGRSPRHLKLLHVERRCKRRVDAEPDLWQAQAQAQGKQQWRHRHGRAGQDTVHGGPRGRAGGCRWHAVHVHSV